MKRTSICRVIAITIVVSAGAVLWLQHAPTDERVAVVPARPPAPVALGQPTVQVRPVRFEANVGQAAPAARFVARGAGYDAEVFDDGVRVSRQAAPAADGAAARQASSARLRFVGARAATRFDTRERAEGTTHYLVGADASKWLRDIPSYRQLRQTQLYPGVDLVYYGRNGAFEYDLVVQPGADASRIRIAVASDARPVIDAQGDLLLDGAAGSLRMHRPVLYQHIAGEKKVLDGEYVMLAANEVGFRLPAYDHAHPLVIDPTFKLLYSTYIGGVHDDQVGGMAVDAQGNSYVVGFSGSEDWPVTGNAWQTTRKAIGRYVRNVVVTKFDPAGTLVYSTFIGGSSNDYGRAIAVDAAGRAFLVGTTNSSDYPTTAGAFQAGFAGPQSTFFSVLSADGSALVYSTLYGGVGGSSASAIALDGAIAVVGGTAGPGLPTTAGAYKTTLATGNGAYVARFDLAQAGAAQLAAATYYGTDAPQTNFLTSGVIEHTMALDGAGTPWITGQAYTTNLPVTAGAVMASPIAMTPSCSPGSVPLNSFAWLAHLSADLKSLVYATYLTGHTGGPATCAEYAYALSFDAAGNVFVGGSTSSHAFPTTAGALQATTPANNGFDGYASFITKLKADGSAILWSTYFGGDAGRTYMSAVTHAADGSLWSAFSTAGGSNFPITADGYQKTHGGATFDGAFARLDAATGALVYSTYLGGAGDDSLIGFAVDPGGSVHVAGHGTSANFPVTTDAFQPALTPGAYDGSDWFFSILGSGAISRVLPATSGNDGDVTLRVTGVGLQAGATASFVTGATTAASASGFLAADGVTATFGFSLAGVAPGRYDLVVTNPDGTVITKPAAFTVQAGGTPILSAQVLGRPKFRTGVPTTFQVVVSNSGTQEAIMVPLWITVPATATLAIDNFSVADTASMLAATEGSKIFVNRLIGKLSPGESTTISVQLTTATDAAFVPVTAALQAPWFRTVAQFDNALLADSYDSDCVVDAANPAYSNCLGSYQTYAILGTRPLARGLVVTWHDARVAAERMRALGDICKPLDHAKEERDKGIADGKEDLKNGKSPGDDGSAFKRDVPNPAKDPIGWINYNAGYINGQFSVITGGGSAGAGRSGIRASRAVRLDGGTCPVKPPTQTPPTLPPTGTGGGSSGGAIDPNDKTGPAGDGSASHYIRNDAPLAYQIEFENLATAALPAANVVVSDQLDPTKVDLSTLTLGSISFGNTTVPVPPGLSSYQTTLTLSPALAVRVQGSLDTASGLLKWTFTTLDPLTHLPPADPTLGFLPPDTDGVKGQGSVNFSVRQKSGATAGSMYANLATVVFDNNAPIVTPTWINKVDATAPTSMVQSLAGQVGTTDFDVTWNGSDTGAGIGGYTVYVADNGGPWTRWQSGVSATTATYAGVSGHSYAFYSVASDGAGNVEPAKAAAEATITVNGNFAAPSSADGGGGCTIGGDGRRDMGLPVLVMAAALMLFIGRRRVATRRRRAAD